MVNLLAKYPETKGIRITGGGEPLVNLATIDFIKECHDRGIQVGLETNGGLLNDKSIDIISRCCRYCRVSLDAGSPEVYKLLHRVGPGEFDRVIHNINDLTSAKVRELGVSYLVVDKNVDDIPKLGALGLSVDYIHFKPLIQGIDQNVKKRALNWLEGDESHHYFNGISLRYDRLIQDDICNTNIPCRITKLIRRVGGDGEEYVCCEHAYESDFKINVWNGDTSKCRSCRYNGYNEILESYYSNKMAKELL